MAYRAFGPSGGTLRLGGDGIYFLSLLAPQSHPQPLIASRIASCSVHTTPAFSIATTTTPTTRSASTATATPSAIYRTTARTTLDFHRPNQLPSSSSSFSSSAIHHHSPRDMSSAPPTLAELLARNQEWQTRTLEVRPDLFKSCAAGQTPKVLWIGCSDSRLPESVITDTDPGQIFVARNIANQFNPEDDNVISILTYGVQALGVEHIVVVGHTLCGGMIAASEAAIAGSSPGGALGRYLTPLVKLAKSLKENEEAAKLEDPEFLLLLTQESIKQSMRHIAATEIIKDNWAGKQSPLSGKVMKKITIHGWIHDIATGKLKDLSLSLTPPEA
ncbi:hypothetical protein CF319_g5824 [Tilletia indica]|nr:hypothetical protein CF319_g5824 [Tilletia indica]KAE8234248.1 hypothetical protein CF326_g718 [Tilletia indica]